MVVTVFVVVSLDVRELGKNALRRDIRRFHSAEAAIKDTNYKL